MEYLGAFQRERSEVVQARALGLLQGASSSPKQMLMDGSLLLLSSRWVLSWCNSCASYAICIGLRKGS